MRRYALILFTLCSHINFGSEFDMNTILKQQQDRVLTTLKNLSSLLPVTITELEEQMNAFQGRQKSVPTCKVISLVAKAKKVQELPAIAECDEPTIQSNELLVDRKNTVTEILHEVYEFRRELRLERELLEIVAARQTQRKED